MPASSEYEREKTVYFHFLCPTLQIHYSSNRIQMSEGKYMIEFHADPAFSSSIDHTDDQNTSDRFKRCDARDCNQKSIKHLKIKYIKKIGSFCEKCAADLLECGLAEDVECSGSIDTLHPLGI